LRANALPEDKRGGRQIGEITQQLCQEGNLFLSQW
jgi:hypothetical protein